MPSLGQRLWELHTEVFIWNHIVLICFLIYCLDIQLRHTHKHMLTSETNRLDPSSQPTPELSPYTRTQARQPCTQGHNWKWSLVRSWDRQCSSVVGMTAQVLVRPSSSYPPSVVFCVCAWGLSLSSNLTLLTISTLALTSTRWCSGDCWLRGRFSLISYSYGGYLPQGSLQKRALIRFQL